MLHLMGSFVECLCRARPAATRWANMKSKWKRPTKGWKEDGYGLDGGKTGGGEGGVFLHPRPQKAPGPTVP